MKYTLRFKLTSAFLLITLIFSLLIGLFANIILQRQFKIYVMDNLNQTNEKIVTTLESRYRDWGNKWDLTGLENLGVGALTDGLMLRIRDGNDTILWDAMTHNRGLCAEILQGMATNMKSPYLVEFQHINRGYGSSHPIRSCRYHHGYEASNRQLRHRHPGFPIPSDPICFPNHGICFPMS